MVFGPNSSVSGEDGRPVMGEGPRSSFLPSEYGVDMTGSCPVGRENFVPTTRTPCRNVSLSAHVMPISAARKFPSPSRTSLCIFGVGEPYGRVAAGDEPYSFTMAVRSAIALSRAKLSMSSCWYARCICAVSWDTAAIASFNVFTILVTLVTPQSGTSRTLFGDGGVTTVSRFFGGNRISWSSSSSVSESGCGLFTCFE